ncbi:MAG TPA: hypothetical protein VKT81_24190 [Bryobacteraceae bacterium]|nr:hypothetical protein [Bryobacteraceae bacterium]
MPVLLRASCRFYGWILLLYPFALRRRFGQEMAEVFQQQIQDALRHAGWRGVAQAWTCAVEEAILVAIPARLDPGVLGVGALSLLSTVAIFYFVLWGVTPPLHPK